MGKTLEQVCFTENQVSLNFDGEVNITIESSYSYHRGASESGDRVIVIPTSESDLMKLLGYSISKVEASKDGTLSLTFTNGDLFKCFDTSPNFESYHIRRGSTEIHV